MSTHSPSLQNPNVTSVCFCSSLARPWQMVPLKGEGVSQALPVHFQRFTTRVNLEANTRSRVLAKLYPSGLAVSWKSVLYLQKTSRGLIISACVRATISIHISFIGINLIHFIYSNSLRESGAIMVTLSMRLIMTLNVSVWRNQATILRFNICWRTTLQHGPYRLLAFSYCKLCHISMWSSFRAANGRNFKGMVLYLRKVFATSLLGWVKVMQFGNGFNIPEP